MKIITITNRFYPSIGGVESTSWITSRGLARRGHNVIALSSDINSITRGPNHIFEEKHTNIEGVEIFRFKNVMPWVLSPYGVMGYIMPGITLEFNQFIKDADIVHSHTYGFFPSYGILPFVRNKKFSWVITSSTSPDSNLPRWIYDATIGL